MDAAFFQVVEIENRILGCYLRMNFLAANIDTGRELTAPRI